MQFANRLFVVFNPSWPQGMHWLILAAKSKIIPSPHHVLHPNSPIYFGDRNQARISILNCPADVPGTNMDKYALQMLMLCTVYIQIAKRTCREPAENSFLSIEARKKLIYRLIEGLVCPVSSSISLRGEKVKRKKIDDKKWIFFLPQNWS